MLSWQRISTLIRRTKGPLFFFDERELQEPIVILPLSVYESLLRPEDKKGESEVIRVPVRLEQVSTPQAVVQMTMAEERSFAPDLRSEESIPRRSGVGSDPGVSSDSIATSEQPLIVTPPASFIDERNLEERFYFQPPVSDEYR